MRLSHRHARPRWSRPLAAASALAVLGSLGCENLPTATDIPEEPPGMVLSTDAWTTLHALLDDPLIDAVVVQADQTRPDRWVHHTMQRVRDRVTAGEPAAIRLAVEAARRELRNAPEDAGLAGRAALGLTLEAAQSLLDSILRGAPMAAPAAPPAAPSERRKP